MRIVAGSARGRRLAVPPGLVTRPTSDRAREGLFSTLTSLTTLAGAAVLDLYAGSGALGLEALSRGAATATLVESDPAVLTTLRANVGTLGLAGAQVVARSVESFVTGLAAAATSPAYDIVVADPPYVLPGEQVSELLSQLVLTGALGPAAVLAVERGSRGVGLVWPEGVAPLRERRYGEATLWYGRAP